MTSSGPYRFTRHPLYLGSTIIGVGLAVASASVIVAVLVALYLAVTLGAAIATEEAHLTEKFGAAYPAYREGRATSEATPVQRRARDEEPRVPRRDRIARSSLRCSRGRPYNPCFGRQLAGPQGARIGGG